MSYIAWNKGLTKETDERIRKMSVNSSNSRKHKRSNAFGKRWKVKNTLKCKEAQKKRWSNVVERKKAAKRMIGHKNTLGKHWKVKDTSKIKEVANKLDTKKKKADAIRGEKNGMFGKVYTRKERQNLREWNIKHPNKKFSNTSIEQKVAAELIKRKINFQQNKGILSIANVDFYLPEHNIIIECDGDYWHSRPDTQKNDKRKTKLLQQNRFNVYRFWEHEINKSTENCIDQIKL